MKTELPQRGWHVAVCCALYELFLTTVATASAKAKAQVRHPVSGLQSAEHSVRVSIERQKDGGSSMNTTFSILVAATLLVAPTSADAARPAPVNTFALPPMPQISTAPPQTNPIGGVNQSLSVQPGVPEINPITGQDFGALPGEPGSPTYDPNAALPSLNNQGSALAPLGGTLTAPTTSPGGTSSR